MANRYPNCAQPVPPWEATTRKIRIIESQRNFTIFSFKGARKEKTNAGVVIHIASPAQEGSIKGSLLRIFGKDQNITRRLSGI